MLLPRDMETLDDCLCPSNVTVTAGSFRCPDGSGPSRLMAKSFKDCSCLTGYKRDDKHETCNPSNFQCVGRYMLPRDLETAESIADCDCQHPYKRDDAKKTCFLKSCPRAGNYVRKTRHKGIKSLADCICVSPYTKDAQSGECVIEEEYTCPPRSSALANVRPKSFADCHCEWGFIRSKDDDCERERPSFVCPINSVKKATLAATAHARGFHDCECSPADKFQRNEATQSCEPVDENGLVTTTRDAPFVCPPFSKPLAAVPHSVQQCTCLPGYGWKTPEMVCVAMSTYKCPAHSHRRANTHVEQTFADCVCAGGYLRDDASSSCMQWILANEGGCPPFSYLQHWPLQSKANCQCLYGIEDAPALAPENQSDDEEGTKKTRLTLRERRNKEHSRTKKQQGSTCRRPPTGDDKSKAVFSQCPDNALVASWPMASLQDCACMFGYTLEEPKDQESEAECVPTGDDFDAEEQAANCRAPMVMNAFTGECRLPVEEVVPRRTRDGEPPNTGTVLFKGIEYDYVLTEENIMIVQGDIAIGELMTWNNNDGRLVAPTPVLHGYYNSDRDHRWKDARLCYQLDPSARLFNSVLNDAMQYITDVTGFRFTQCIGNSCAKDHACAHDYVLVKATPSSCFSYIGRVGGEQMLGVSADCGMGNLVHVLLHSVGLHHTIDRADRDEHVRIAWECLPDDKRSYFVVEEENNTKSSTDTPYDFFSIMHHPAQAFVHSRSKAQGYRPDWCQSMLPLVADEAERMAVLSTMGQRDLMAVTDIHAVWRLYPSLHVLDFDDQPVHTDGDDDTVHRSRLHTEDDVLEMLSGQAPSRFGGSVKPTFTQRAASFFGAMVTLCAFGGVLAFVAFEIKRRGILRQGDSYYSESLLTDTPFA